MASNLPFAEEPPCNSLTDEETVALRKKRSRRVSFADREITSVHIFNRDEDFETPPDSSSDKKQQQHDVSEAENELLGFFRDLADSDDSKEMYDNDDEEDGVVNARKSFLRPMESPSPGSSTIAGSATSNDEDNFFGPVSASFIRHATLSDSVASDDNHDVTMDSTAFSMHFRSLARSDSEGNTLIEEKTPLHITTPSDSGSFMVLTKAKKLVPQFSLPIEKVSGGRDSNDMSLVGENLRNYDYGKLSPRLEALLAEGSKDLKNISASDSTNKKSLKRSEFNYSSGGHMDQKNCGDKETENIDKLDVYSMGVSSVDIELDEANDVSSINLVDQTTNGCSSHRNEDLVADISIDQGVEIPNQLKKMNNDYFLAVTGVGPDNMNGKVIQSISFAQYESRKNLEEATPNNRKGNVGLYQNSAQQLRSPRLGYTSSVSPKQQQTFLNASKSSRQLSCVTPSPKQPCSLLGKENIKSGENMMSIHKSSSRFKIFEPSPLASALKDGIERSKLRLSRLHSSTMSPFNIVAEENCRNTEGKIMDATVVDLEMNLLSVDHINRHHEGTGYMDATGIGNLRTHGSLGNNWEAETLAEDGEPLLSMPMHALSKEGDNHMMTEVVSPFHITQPQKKARQPILMPEKSSQCTMVVFESDSSSADIQMEHRNDVKTVNPSDKFVSPQAKTLVQKLSSLTEQGTISHALQSDELRAGLGQDKNSTGNVTCGSYSTAVTNVSESVFAERRTQSSSSLLENNHFREDKVHDRQCYRPNLQHASETSPSFGTPSRERNAMKFLSGNSDTPLATEQILSEEEVSVEQNEDFLCISASPSIHRRIMNEPSDIKSPREKEMTQSPIKQELMQSSSSKDQCEISIDENVQSLAEKRILSSNSTSSEPDDGDSDLTFQVSGGETFAQDTKNSSVRKRRIDESVPADISHADKIQRIKSSPNIHKTHNSVMEFMSESVSGSGNVTKMSGRNNTMKQWTDILLKFSSDTQQLLSPLVDKLNIRLICVLQDILTHLQKVKLYETLCWQIRSQKTCDQLSEVRNNRVTETKVLLYKLVYEKARQQLMSVNRERVLKKAQQLSSAVQKSQMLNSNTKCLLLPSDKGTSTDANLQNPSRVDLGSKNEVSMEKLAMKKHEFEALNRSITNLTKVLHSYCKIKGEPSCFETIILLNDHLREKSSCRFIHQDLQLWEVDDLGSRNGKRNVVLHYQGLIFQRFVMDDDPIPSIFVSNKLDDLNIVKNYPNMDACVPFASVLNVKTTKKHSGSKSFAQETQTTCSLIHNLLDVLGEVQLAQLEIKNLVQTSFRSSSGQLALPFFQWFLDSPLAIANEGFAIYGQLDLQLSFIDPNSGRKVMVTLDLTCLNCGVYPSDIFPYQLEASVAGTGMPLPESPSTKIKAAVDGLTIGYSRIIRLCRCISQVLQSLST